MDDENGLKHVFQSAGQMRRNYNIFGDVVAFDARCETNKYFMIFAPFIGYDQHPHSINLGDKYFVERKN